MVIYTVFTLLHLGLNSFEDSYFSIFYLSYYSVEILFDFAFLLLNLYFQLLFHTVKVAKTIFNGLFYTLER